MTIVFHRFPLSHFSEKGRALLDFKELDYRVVEHQLGLPQLEIYRLSGQRKVPVIEHDGKVISDSTDIALYLESSFPDGRRLLPVDERSRRDVLKLEDRLDRVLGGAGPVAWFARLPLDRVRQFVEVEAGMGASRARIVSRAIVAGLNTRPALRFAERCTEATRRLLAELCERLDTTPYLVGDEPTLADVAAVGLAFHLKFPRSAYLTIPSLAGVAAPGIGDDPAFARFFDWRDELYERYLS